LRQGSSFGGIKEFFSDIILRTEPFKKPNPNWARAGALTGKEMDEHLPARG